MGETGMTTRSTRANVPESFFGRGVSRTFALRVVGRPIPRSSCSLVVSGPWSKGQLALGDHGCQRAEIAEQSFCAPRARRSAPCRHRQPNDHRGCSAVMTPDAQLVLKLRDAQHTRTNLSVGIVPKWVSTLGVDLSGAAGRRTVTHRPPWRQFLGDERGVACLSGACASSNFGLFRLRGGCWLAKP